METYTSLDTFRPEINQYCPGTPGILIRNHLIKAAIKFCERTLILKKNPSTFYLDDEEHTYTLKFTGDRYRVVALDEVRLGTGTGSKRLGITTQSELSSSDPNWRESEGSGDQPKACFLTEDLNKIRIVPTPNSDSTDELYIKAVVVPMRDQTEIDTFLYEKWEEVIQAGALATLFNIKISSWYDARQARDAERAFKRGVGTARKTALSGTGNYPGRALPQNFVIIGDGGTSRRTLSWV